MKWSESAIGRALAHEVFNRKHLVVVPNTKWTGHECDILAVTHTLHLIDVEIKISRADLKADAAKEKWWHREFVGYGETVDKLDERGRLICRNRPYIYDSTPREWPPKIWKHYFAMPMEIWSNELLTHLPSKSSGVLLLFTKKNGGLGIECRRHAKANKEAEPIDAGMAIHIARLASLRMWTAEEKLEKARAQAYTAAPQT